MQTTFKDAINTFICLLKVYYESNAILISSL